MGGVKAGFLHANSALWVHGELANRFHPACLLDRPGPASLDGQPRLNAIKISFPVCQRRCYGLDFCKPFPAIWALGKVNLELLPFRLRQHATGQKRDVLAKTSAMMEGPFHVICSVAGGGKAPGGWRTPRRWRVTPTLGFAPPSLWDCQIAFISIHPLIRRGGSFSFCAISPRHDAAGISLCPPNSRALRPYLGARPLRRSAAK